MEVRKLISLAVFLSFLAFAVQASSQDEKAKLTSTDASENNTTNSENVPTLRKSSSQVNSHSNKTEENPGQKKKLGKGYGGSRQYEKNYEVHGGSGGGRYGHGYGQRQGGYGYNNNNGGSGYGAPQGGYGPSLPSYVGGHGGYGSGGYGSNDNGYSGNGDYGENGGYGGANGYSGNVGYDGNSGYGGQSGGYGGHTSGYGGGGSGAYSDEGYGENAHGSQNGYQHRGYGHHSSGYGVYEPTYDTHYCSVHGSFLLAMSEDKGSSYGGGYEGKKESYGGNGAYGKKSEEYSGNSEYNGNQAYGSYKSNNGYGVYKPRHHIRQYCRWGAVSSARACHFCCRVVARSSNTSPDEIVSAIFAFDPSEPSANGFGVDHAVYGSDNNYGNYGGYGYDQGQGGYRKKRSDDYSKKPQEEYHEQAKGYGESNGYVDYGQVHYHHGRQAYQCVCCAPKHDNY